MGTEPGLRFTGRAARPLFHATVGIALVGGLLVSGPSSRAVAQQAETVAVTIAELVRSHEQYSGKEVVFEGILVGTTYLLNPEGITVTGPGRSRRFQIGLADMSGARILVITWMPSYDLPSLGMIGRTGTVYAVRGTFYHAPMEPGPPLQFVVPRSKEGLRRK